MIKKSNTKIKDPEIILTAREIKLAKILASNDKKLRDKTLKRLQKWLGFRSQSSMELTEQDFMPLWKGLFYCMWMSDKLLPQEECAEMIANLIHSLHDFKTQLLFFKCFLKTMINEWFGIDQYRLNKFLMLIRRTLRQALYCLKKTNWNIEFIKNFNAILTETVLNHKIIVPLGLSLHFIEIYLEELAKVGNEKIEEVKITEFVRPFAERLIKLKDSREIGQIIKFIFRYLIDQSDVGIEYQEKFKAWRQRGYPGGTIDAMEKVEESEDEEISMGEADGQWIEEAINEDDDSGPKDPRAGQVDVLLPQIKFNPTAIADMIVLYKFDKESTPKTRKIINKLVRDFKLLAKGEYPFGIKSVYQPTEKDYEATNIQAAAERLVAFEERLVDKKLTKSEKKLLKKQNSLMTAELDTPEEGVHDNNTKQQKRKLKVNDAEESGMKSSKKKLKLSKNSEKNLEKFIDESERDLLENFVKNKNTNKLGDKGQGVMESSICQNGEVKIGIDDTGGVWEVTESTNLSTTKNKGKKLLKDGNKIKSKKLVKEKKLKSKLVGKKKSKNKVKLTREIKEKSKTRDNQNNEKVENTINLSNENTIDIITPIENNITNTKNTVNNNSLVTENSSRNDSSSTDGEIEIFVPSKKFIQKAKQQGKNINELLTEIDNKILQTKKNNKKLLVENPFSTKNKVLHTTENIVKKSTTETNEKKKVRIALSLNKSQDTKAYRLQVLRSPAIPYDAHKKPSKPLLKNKSDPSPINPFYKLNKFLR